jgi:hypothetical protein
MADYTTDLLKLAHSLERACLMDKPLRDFDQGEIYTLLRLVGEASTPTTPRPLASYNSMRICGVCAHRSTFYGTCRVRSNERRESCEPACKDLFNPTDAAMLLMKQAEAAEKAAMEAAA